MRILITGGTGLIGRALVAELTRAGRELMVLSRTPDRVTFREPGVRVIHWDARTPTGWETALENVDAVINLAGESIAAGRWTAARKFHIEHSRVDTGAALTAAIAAAQVKPRILVQASAVGIYGPRGDEPLDETALPGADFLSRVAVAWEASTAPVEALGVRRAIIRLGVVLSTQGGALPRMTLPFRLFAGGYLGHGRQRFPWIHIADVTGAIRFLLEREDAKGVFNLTAPAPPTNAEFSRALGRALKRPSWLPTPAFALRLLLGEMATVLLDGQNALPRRLQALGYDFRYPALEPALRALFNREAGA